MAKLSLFCRGGQRQLASVGSPSGEARPLQPAQPHQDSMNDTHTGARGGLGAALAMTASQAPDAAEPPTSIFLDI